VGAVALLAMLIGTSSTVFADDASRSGTFAGLNDHATTGSVKLEQSGNAYHVVLGDDFSFDGAPDPKVALGKGGEYDAATLMGLLESYSGTQRFEVPAGIDVADYDEVYIWCEKYSVGLGVATLN